LRLQVFIRTPATLFAIEERFQRQKHVVVAKIQAHVRGRQQRAEYLRMKAAGERERDR
jgi:zinc finger CCCH domain-containing protein 13